MAQLAYSAVSQEWQNPNFLQRIAVALVQTALVKCEAEPPASLSTVADHEDKLARSILANPAFWAAAFAYPVAIQLIGNTTLLDETVTTDAAIFSAIGTIYDKMLPSLA